MPRQKLTAAQKADRLRAAVRRYQAKNRVALREKARAARAKNPEAHRAYLREQRKKHPERHAAYVRKHQYKKKYGITLEEYDAMVLVQGGKCAICLTTEPGNRGGRWAIDHCHHTRKVRQLLCLACNTGLGFFNDDTDLLRRAVRYLELHHP